MCDPQKLQGMDRRGAVSAGCCAVQVVAFCDCSAPGTYQGTVVLVFLPLPTATLQYWQESCVDTVVLA